MACLCLCTSTSTSSSRGAASDLLLKAVLAAIDSDDDFRRQHPLISGELSIIATNAIVMNRINTTLILFVFLRKFFSFDLSTF
jgi:hypothetical protein